MFVAGFWRCLFGFFEGLGAFCACFGVLSCVLGVFCLSDFYLGFLVFLS